MIHIIAIGKKHDSWIEDGLERYEKRLRSPFDVRWQLLSYSHFDADKARQDESERILAKLSDDDFVILLDERGKNMPSPDISRYFVEQFSRGRNITLVIGGAYGVNSELTQRANLVWSLSRLVFPHQLVRLILIEQIYRSQEIYHNRPYHHQ